MRDETPDIAAARAAVESAVQQYADAVADEGSPFVTSWIVALEFTSAALDSEGNTVDDVCVPLTQSRATSRGLLGLALDHYTRTA